MCTCLFKPFGCGLKTQILTLISTLSKNAFWSNKPFGCELKSRILTHISTVSKDAFWSKFEGHLTVQFCRAWSQSSGDLRGSVVVCLTRNPEVRGSSRIGTSAFFVGVSLGKTLQSPSLVLLKPRKDMNNVRCRRDMTEILLKAA